MCGEWKHFKCRLQDHLGLSPRVREVGRRAPYTRDVLRFIPACAGSGDACRTRLSRHRVYPRVCGEWRREPKPGNISRRFIPACAGSGPVPDLTSGKLPVYPRVCGEWPGPEFPSAFDAGLSPRVRGVGRRSARDGSRLRFIPACAGSGSPGWWMRGTRWVYPRVCGEKADPDTAAIPDRGLSPRVRGEDVRGDLCAQDRRFIPACAGRRPSPGTGPTPARVYPRVCGEECLV